MNLLIQRTYQLDVDLSADTDASASELATEIATGLLLTHQVIVPAEASGHRWATIRFTGAKSQLAKLVYRFAESGLYGLTEAMANAVLDEDETVGAYVRRISGARDDGDYSH